MIGKETPANDNASRRRASDSVESTSLRFLAVLAAFWFVGNGIQSLLGLSSQPSKPEATVKPPSSTVLKEVDFGPYMAKLQRQIKRHWFPPKQSATKRVVVIFKIHKDGSLSDLRTSKGSGFALSDEAALLAVQHAAPFAPLPEGASENVDIQFTFDYNVFHPASEDVEKSKAQDSSQDAFAVGGH